MNNQTIVAWLTTALGIDNEMSTQYILFTLRDKFVAGANSPDDQARVLALYERLSKKWRVLQDDAISAILKETV